jgi:hypothetical protein
VIISYLSTCHRRLWIHASALVHIAPVVFPVALPLHNFYCVREVKVSRHAKKIKNCEELEVMIMWEGYCYTGVFTIIQISDHQKKWLWSSWMFGIKRLIMKQIIIIDWSFSLERISYMTLLLNMDSLFDTQFFSSLYNTPCKFFALYDILMHTES